MEFSSDGFSNDTVELDLVNKVSFRKFKMVFIGFRGTFKTKAGCKSFNWSWHLEGSILPHKNHPFVAYLPTSHMMTLSISIKQIVLSPRVRPIIGKIWRSLITKALKCRSPLKILWKKTGFAWNSHPQRHSVQTVFFKFNPLFLVLAFQILYQDPRSG